MIRKNIYNKLLGVLLCVSILLGIAPAAAIWAEALSEEQKMIQGSFYYMNIHGQDEEQPYYYSDEYFSLPASQNNLHLRSMSAAMVFAMTPKWSEKQPYQRVLKLVQELGFDQETIQMDETDTTSSDSIGTLIAQKKLGSDTLVLINIRSMFYIHEWESNFTVGTSGDHKGFSSAAQKVLNRVKSYLETHQISSAKFWMVGYSRGGAVANLAGKTITEQAGDYATSPENVFVYTFDAPAASADDTVYQNIHNVVNENDAIPYACPAGWGLYLNGSKELLKAEPETIMTRKLNLLSTGYLQDYRETKKNDFLKSFSQTLGEEIKREDFAPFSESYLAPMVRILLTMSDADRAQFVTYLQTVFSYMKADGTILLAASVLTQPENVSLRKQAVDAVCRVMDQTKKELPTGLTDEEYSLFRSAIQPGLEAFLPLVLKEVVRTVGSDSVPFYYLVSFADNLGPLVEAHYSDRLFALITSEDSYYHPSLSKEVSEEGTEEISEVSGTQGSRSRSDVPSEQQQSPDNGSLIFWITIGAVLVFLCVVVILLVCRKKKKAKQSQS